MSDPGQDEEFLARRQRARASVNALEREHLKSGDDRAGFFEAVYDRAAGDAAAVPWADLEPKHQLMAWLDSNPGAGRRAIDVACGLGDNAEAIAAAGYQTAAFDLSEKAIDWARRRFPDSPVSYRKASLLDLPAEWRSAFDLVHECYTIQSVPPDMHRRFAAAIASLVRPGGTLLLYARTAPEGAAPDGPPWPLRPAEYGVFETLGFKLFREERFDLVRPDRTIPHVFAQWKRG